MTELVKISGLSNSSDGGDEGAGILEQEAFISVSSVSMANGLEGALNRLVSAFVWLLRIDISNLCRNIAFFRRYLYFFTEKRACLMRILRDTHVICDF